MNSINFFCNFSRFIFIISSVTILTSCGGGGSTPPVTTPTTAPVTAATPTLGFDIKTFRFTWVDVSDATFYRLMENPDGVSGFIQIGGDITAGTQSLDHVVALFQRLNASYILQSCNSFGCTDAATTPITGTLTEAIGYFKGSTTDMGDEFGLDVALSSDGNTLAVGAKNESSNADGINGDESDNTAVSAGAVYIYVNNAGTWEKQAYIKAINSAMFDEFGTSVSLSADGNLLAVGAPKQGGSGFVHTYTRTGSIWSVQGSFNASVSAGNDLFGGDVSLSDDGSTLAVGANSEASTNPGLGEIDNVTDVITFVGAAYIFTESGGIWTQQKYIKAANADAGDFFGASVSLSADGNTLAVGANGEDGNTSGVGTVPANSLDAATGAVYVFTRSGMDWSQQEYIKASDSDAGDSFGFAVSLSDDGNTLAVGAPSEASNAVGIDGDDTNNLAGGSGAVYVFTRSNTVWAQQVVYIKASNTDIGDLFGKSVSISANGDALAVGAEKEQSNATGINGDQNDNSLNIANGSGAAYMFTRNAGSWSQQAYVKANNPNINDFYGTALELSGDGNTLAVGALDEDSNATGVGGNELNNDVPGSGAVYLY